MVAMNQKLVMIWGRRFRPRWGRWRFLSELKARREIARAEESVSKDGKELKSRKSWDLLLGQRGMQQVIRGDVTMRELRSRKKVRERRHIALQGKPEASWLGTCPKLKVKRRPFGWAWPGSPN